MKTERICLIVATAAVATMPVFAQGMASRRPAGQTQTEGAATNHDRPGFATRMHRDRLWVFVEGSEALAAFDAEKKTPAVHTVRPLAGPDNLTVISPESNDLIRYLTWKEGFETRVHRERLWVFPVGAEALAKFDAERRVPAVHTVRPLAGPMGMTIIAEDAEILDAYMLKE